MDHTEQGGASILKQPRTVWAVAFACVISFMGIGLVDPILPALAEQLQASPATVSLLFTSYLVVTAIAMLGVGWVSSRIGTKWTLVVGLAVIVVFSALAGSASSILEIVWFRGGWGLGNALFIATSLAVIVASASGGFSGAIVLYEAALGIGIAVGPLVGGLLGDISWRGPFFGVAGLMAIALVATLLFVPPIPRPSVKTKLSAPLTALGHRGLLTMGIVALLYNWGFFTMLGYAPYPMKLGALQLGYVFFGWGVLVALFAVFVAPRVQRRFGTAAVLYVNLAVLGVIMCMIALGVDNPPAVMAAVIVSGACIGINNTLTTQAVMLVSPVQRSVASSAYGSSAAVSPRLSPARSPRPRGVNQVRSSWARSRSSSPSRSWPVGTRSSGGPSRRKTRRQTPIPSRCRNRRLPSPSRPRARSSSVSTAARPHAPSCVVGHSSPAKRAHTWISCTCSRPKSSRNWQSPRSTAKRL